MRDHKIVGAIAIAVASGATATLAFSPPSSLANHAITQSRGLTREEGGSNNFRAGPLLAASTSVAHYTKKAAASAASNAASNAASTAASAAAAAAASVAPVASSNLAVSLDRPLLSPVEYTYRAPSSRGVWSSFLTVLLSDVFKTALVAFLLAVGVSLVPRLLSTVTAGGGSSGGSGGGNPVSAFVSDRIVTPVREALRRRGINLPGGSGGTSGSSSSYSAPMPFEGDGGWGKCALRSKKPIGMSFTLYEFALPESYYTVPLALGQQLDFCCLSSSDDICTGSFYPHEVGGGGGGGSSAGVVRVVLPNDKVADEGNSKFVSFLRVSTFVFAQLLICVV